MNRTACPHCGAKLPLAVDAFCAECRGDLSEPPGASVDDSPKPVAAKSAGIPFGRIFGGLGILAGVASGAMSLSRIGGTDQVAHPSWSYLIGYLFGSAAVLGLIGLVFGVVLGRLIACGPSK